MGACAGDSLEQAQLNKLDALIGMAGINEADHVLEIGCGWGSMAIRAVQVGPPLSALLSTLPANETRLGWRSCKESHGSP